MYKIVGWQGTNAAHDTVHGSEPGRALLWGRWVGQRELAPLLLGCDQYHKKGDVILWV